MTNLSLLTVVSVIKIGIPCYRAHRHNYNYDKVATKHLYASFIHLIIYVTHNSYMPVAEIYAIYGIYLTFTSYKLEICKNKYMFMCVCSDWKRPLIIELQD